MIEQASLWGAQSELSAWEVFDATSKAGAETWNASRRIAIQALEQEKAVMDLWRTESRYDRKIQRADNVFAALMRQAQIEYEARCGSEKLPNC